MAAPAANAEREDADGTSDTSKRIVEKSGYASMPL
jgi:hypothetical protein